jgi:hypothetical protein
LTGHPAEAEARSEYPAHRGGISHQARHSLGNHQQVRRLMRGDQVTRPPDPQPQRYEICVRGRLGETIRSAFPALQAQASGGDTVLTGPLPDRAALYGVLAQIEALGLELLEVRRLPPV